MHPTRDVDACAPVRFPRPRRTALLAALPLVTGAALVVHILAGIVLPLAVGAAFAGSAALVLAAWRGLPAELRTETARRVRIGLVGGIAATLAYDATRLVLVWVAGFRFGPLDTLPIFGRLLIGPDASPGLALGAGVLYHAANGVGFATAFVLVVRSPTAVKGVAWAAMLELAMVSLYPGWLRIDLLGEFLGVSVLGHVAYGLVLGGVTAILVRSTSRAERPESGRLR